MHCTTADFSKVHTLLPTVTICASSSQVSIFSFIERIQGLHTHQACACWTVAVDDNGYNELAFRVPLNGPFEQRCTTNSQKKTRNILVQETSNTFTATIEYKSYPSKSWKKKNKSNKFWRNQNEKHSLSLYRDTKNKI